MAKASTHKGNIVRAAAKLFRSKGYVATGLNEILARADAPKGSLYHYFPGGKEELGAYAVRSAGEAAARSFEDLAADGADAAQVLRRFATLLGGWMAKTDFEEGCPVATVLLEMASESASIRQAGDDALAAWAAVLARRLEADGVPAPRAARLARFAIASLEGGMLLARVEQSAAPIMDAAEEAAAHFARVIEETRGG